MPVQLLDDFATGSRRSCCVHDAVMRLLQWDLPSTETCMETTMETTEATSNGPGPCQCQLDLPAVCWNSPPPILDAARQSSGHEDTHAGHRTRT